MFTGANGSGGAAGGGYNTNGANGVGSDSGGGGGGGWAGQLVMEDSPVAAVRMPVVAAREKLLSPTQLLIPTLRAITVTSNMSIASGTNALIFRCSFRERIHGLNRPQRAEGYRMSLPRRTEGSNLLTSCLRRHPIARERRLTSRRKAIAVQRVRSPIG